MRIHYGYCTWLYKAQYSDGSSPVATSIHFYHVDKISIIFYK
nr:MAG TPA: hypothetical protein [Caudoviricetes sp.]